MADLIEQLGGIPPDRIWIHPAPGTATEHDVIEAEARENRLCELVDGVLVEKPMGVPEAMVAVTLIRILGAFVHARKLGVVLGPDGILRIRPGLICLPDVAFLSRAQLAGRRLSAEQVPALAPDLAVEVLSPSNTVAEMDRKRREYFGAGTRLVWQIDPTLGRRSVAVYETADQPPTVLGEDQLLDGGSVLSGFSLPVRDLFAELDEDWTDNPVGP